MNQIIISHNNYLIKQFLNEKKNILKKKRDICKINLENSINECLNNCKSKKCLQNFKKYVKCFLK